MSKEQKEFLKKRKRRKHLVLLTQIIIFISFIFLWQFLSDKNIINSFITSSPKKIIFTIINLIKNNNLFIHIITTLNETIISFTITTVLSLIIAIILYFCRFIKDVIEPYLIILSSLPKVALSPLIIILLGANTKSIIVMAISISLIVSIQSILEGFTNTDKNKLKLLKTFNANKKDILFYLLLKENKENIFNTLKINISMCLIGVIMGEFLTSKQGIGYLILYGSQIFNLDLIMTGIFILTIFSLFLYLIVLKLNKK